MTSPSGISFRFLFKFWFRFWIAGLAFSGIGLAGTISGAIDLQRSDRSDIVIWLEPSDPNAPPTPAHRARMLQKDKRFHPHVLVISAGTTVDFPNADPIFHNAFSNFNGQIFDIGLYPPGKSRSVIFRDPGIVRVFCNIHPSMAALIVVVKSPYYATSDVTGGYSIPNVTPGEYRIRVFDERATPEALNAVSRRIWVSDAPMTVPPISISEAGYILAPHSNKYGKSYPPGADNASAYTIPQ